MSSESASAKSIFLRAVEQRPEQWAAFLRDACGDDTELSREVELLLESHQQAGEFLQQGAVANGATVDLSGSQSTGANIGPYKLLQRLGEGGMGEVYMAEQIEPVERRVAVKIIKAGMDTRQVVARFEAEQQALAMMDHPNIAKVHDAGETSMGRPYFVMELVKGMPITQYCDEHRLEPRQRLELFKDVCHAVQHAHQKGIIHRDIKPSNVLVAEYDDVAVPKIIDFGVAKAIQQKLTEKTCFTEVGTIIGTIEYMSPEQAKLNQLDIDTRSDVYSLGVLLYELLTSELPFDQQKLRSAAFDEMLRIIREEEPSRPSIKLSTSESLPAVAARRHVGPQELTRLMRGELDWIVMKALVKERTRRYQSASDLAVDIQNYLTGRPVNACPPSAWYRIKKIARQNRAALTAASVLLLALLVAVGGVAGSLGWLAHSRAAQRERLNSQVRTIVEQAERLMKEKRWGEAAAAAARAETLATSSEAPIQADQLEHLRADLDLVAQLDRARLLLPNIRANQYDYAAADAAYTLALARIGTLIETMSTRSAAEQLRSRPRIRDELVDALFSWSVLRRRQADERKPTWQQLLEVADAIDDNTWRRQVRSAWRKSEWSHELAQLAAAAPLRSLSTEDIVLLARAVDAQMGPARAQQLLARAQTLHADDFWINFELSNYLATSEMQSAEMFLRVALAARPNHPALLNNLGNALNEQGKVPEAVVYYKQAIEFDATFFMPYYNLGNVAKNRKEFTAAVKWYTDALRLSPDYSPARHNLGLAYKEQGEIDKAIEAFEETIRRSPDFALAHYSLGLTQSAAGRADAATASFRRATAADQKLAPAFFQLGVAQAEGGQPEEAIVSFERAIRIDRRYVDAYVNLAVVKFQLGQTDDALEQLHAAIEIDNTHAVAHFSLAVVFEAIGRPESALANYRQAIECRPDYAEAHSNLGVLLVEQGQLKSGIAHLRKAALLMPEHPAHQQNMENAERLLETRNSMPQPDSG